MKRGPLSPRRRKLLLSAAFLASPFPVLATSAAHAGKVLRYAFPAAETGFDPVQIDRKSVV